MPLGMMSDAGDLEVNRLPQQPVFISILGFQHEIMFPNMFISAVINPLWSRFDLHRTDEKIIFLCIQNF